MTTEFPGNSRQPQSPEREQRVVERVTKTEAVARKKGLGKRFKDLFIGGDSKTVVHYVVMDVLVPQAKDMIAEAVSQGFERLIYGESGSTRRVGGGGRSSQPTNYTRYAVRGNNPIGRSERDDRRPTVRPRSESLDEILLATRVEAETVLDRLYDLLRQYGSVPVADLYSLVGWTSNYVQQNWGWTDLQGSNVQRVRDGYVLNLPDTKPLD